MIDKIYAFYYWLKEELYFVENRKILKKNPIWNLNWKTLSRKECHSQWFRMSLSFWDKFRLVLKTSDFSDINPAIGTLIFTDFERVLGQCLWPLGITEGIEYQPNSRPSSRHDWRIEATLEAHRNITEFKTVINPREEGELAADLYWLLTLIKDNRVKNLKQL